MKLKKPILCLCATVLGYSLFIIILFACVNQATAKAEEVTEDETVSVNEVHELDISKSLQPIIVIETKGSDLSEQVKNKLGASEVIRIDSESVHAYFNGEPIVYVEETIKADTAEVTETLIEEEIVDKEIVDNEIEKKDASIPADTVESFEVNMDASPSMTALSEEQAQTEVAAQNLKNISNLTDTYSDDFLSLCSTIHFEAGEAAPIEAKIAVGSVILNRLLDTNKWHYSTLKDVIYASGQFAVTKKRAFEPFKSIVASGNWSEEVETTVLAATAVVTQSELYQQYALEPDVQFFHAGTKYSWGSHKYYDTIGGNSFFRK